MPMSMEGAMSMREYDVPLESVCSRVAKSFFFLFSNIIKCALLSEVACGIHAFSHLALCSVGGVRVRYQQNSHIFFCHSIIEKGVH